MSFTENEILGILLIGAVLVLGIIFFFKRKFSAQTDDLVGKYHSDVLSTSIKKYPEADSFKLNSSFLRLGLVCSLGLAILAFSWTVFDRQIDECLHCDLTIDIETDMPITFPERKTPPPPPPPPVIEDVPNDADLEEDIVFEDIHLQDDFLYEPFESKETRDNDKPIILDEKNEEEDFSIPFIKVEKMPSFPGCESISDNTARDKCTEQKLLQYIYSKIKYPTVATENQIEGKVVIQFVIDQNGLATDIKVLKDIGGGCGDEVVRVLNTMNNLPQKWSPGEQRSRKVSVRYTIPIRYRLKK